MGCFGPRKVANIAPTCPPKRSQNQLKFDTKIDQFFSASWNRFLEGFGWILDAKMKQRLAQNGIKKSMLTSKGDFCKIVLSLQRGFDFLRFGGPKWEQKWTKNRSKNEAQNTMHLGIDFQAILVDFGSQVGAELEASWR